jgi:hypothetical protein
VQNAVPSTIQQLTYWSIYEAVLTWILGANPRAVTIQWRLVAAFMAGLLWFRGTASCSSIARSGVASPDALNRLLTGPLLRSCLQILALSLIPKGKGYLAIDDVIIGKTGIKIAGVKYLYSPSDKRKLLALNAIVLGWTDGDRFIPLTFRFWKMPETKGSAIAFDGTPFKTKIELAIDMLHWAYQRKLAPKAVLFDCYYLTQRLIGWIKLRQWHWVSRIKEGRAMIRNGKPFSAKKWIKLAPIRRAPKLTTSVTAELPGWGMVRIIRANDIPNAKRRFLVGSNPEWGRDVIERLYGYRWKVEVLFRDSSQMLGLKQCQCRSFRAQENHFALVLMTYAFLQSQRRRKETAGQIANRLIERPMPHAAPPPSPTIRRIRPERRHRRRNAHYARPAA